MVWVVLVHEACSHETTNERFYLTMSSKGLAKLLYNSARLLENLATSTAISWSGFLILSSSAEIP